MGRAFIYHLFPFSFLELLASQPKFYFYDPGIVRGLARQLSVPLQEKTYYYGDLFEHLVIIECMKLASYYHPEFRFSYLKTKDDAEVDLIVERPGDKPLFIEIKSTTNLNSENLRGFLQLTNDFKDCEAICLTNETRMRKIEHIHLLPWQEGVKQFFGDTT